MGTHIEVLAFTKSCCAVQEISENTAENTDIHRPLKPWKDQMQDIHHYGKINSVLRLHASLCRIKFPNRTISS